MSTLKLKQSKSPFLATFKLDRKSLLLGDRARGTPTLKLGTDERDNPVLVKIWARDSRVDDSELEAIWKNEVRQLHRLAGAPRAYELISRLEDSHLDEWGYYIVLQLEQRLPLASLLAGYSVQQLRSLRSAASRRQFWANFSRLAQGLEILHGQGLLHRNINQWAVLTSGRIDPDFQLTGFEWSMRIVGATPKESRRIGGAHSFAQDWAQFGQLIIELLGVEKSRVLDLRLPAHSVSSSASAGEIRLIRDLVRVGETQRIDGRVVSDRIRDLIAETERLDQFPFILVVPFTAGSRPAIEVRKASGFEIDLDDDDAQLAFVKSDLKNPILMLIDQPWSNRQSYVLRGAHLTYFVDDFVRKGVPTNWDYAVCGNVEAAAPNSAHIVGQLQLQDGQVQVLRLGTANKAGASVRLTNWRSLTSQLTDSAADEDVGKQFQRSLVLAQLVDYLYAACDIFPVLAQSRLQQHSDADERVMLEVKPRTDSVRDELSMLLDLPRTLGARLASALSGDETADEKLSSWILTDIPAIGDASPLATIWQYSHSRTSSSGEEIFVLVGDRPAVATSRELYLVPADAAARDAQLARRMRYFEGLLAHSELTEILANAQARVKNSHELVVEDEPFFGLDESKREALRVLFATVPLFMVQGPPGVGKTKLVTQLVRQILCADNSSRILLSAQSNHAVDHLLQQVSKLDLDSLAGDILAVRCASRERRDPDSEFDIANQAARVIKSITASQAYTEASDALKVSVTELIAQFDGSSGGGVGGRTSTERRALEQLVLRASNLVFATTNSYDLERLIEDSSQFDWSVVEEAAKASGGELIAPLLLAPRRVMIGDHQQLPPFDSERTTRILNKPERVKRALVVGEGLIGRQLLDSTADDIIELAGEEDETALRVLCGEAALNVLLFERLIEAEFARVDSGRPGRQVAATLQKQHRMHPQIAELVSHCFYRDALSTDEEARKRFETEPCPVVTVDPLPDRPLTWVEMPWVQRKVGMKNGELPPRHINLDEVAAVREVLARLAPRRNDERPSLAVLSPYKKQVGRLSRGLDLLAGTDKALSLRFRPVEGSEDFVHTVDSFQGNEADVVVVSLVRNNNRGSIRSALGFLGDSRRMNVLLSRARHKLIIVGSLDFLTAVCSNPKSKDDSDQIEFLQKMILRVGDPARCAIVNRVDLVRSRR